MQTIMKRVRQHKKDIKTSYNMDIENIDILLNGDLDKKAKVRELLNFMIVYTARDDKSIFIIKKGE